MKSFADFRRDITEMTLAESTVFDKRIGGVPVKIVKSGSAFKVMIDGDVLDEYDTEKQAVDMATQFVNQWKGK